MQTPKLRCLGWIGCLLSALTLSAAPKLDLERLDPVPDDQPIPIQDFFRPANFTAPELNFAGTHVAALVSGGLDKYKLMVVELATNDMQILSGVGRMDVYRFDWLTNERLIFSLSAEKRFGVALAAANVGGLHNPYPLIQYGRHRVVGIPETNRLRPLAWVSELGRGKDGGIVVLNTDVNTGNFVDLLRANVNGYDFSLVEDYNRKQVARSFPVPEGGIQAGYFSDKEGNLAYSYTMRDGLATLQTFNGETWAPSPVDMEFVDVLGVGEERSKLIVNQYLYNGEPSPVREMDSMTGEMGRILMQDKGYDFDGYLYRDRATRLPVGAVFHRATPAVVWFNQTYQDLQKLFEGSFPRKIVRIVSSNEAASVFILSVSSDVDPVAYFVVDLEKKSLGPLKTSRPWIDPKRMNRMNIIKYKTADGQKLDAYLTLPKGASKDSPVPLVVYPHGGPWVRDVWGFDSSAQHLASRGYAVLQPNYRGSPGYNWMFPEPDQYDFIKMHEDVTAATKTVLRTGLIQTDRVAIMGGSFGAYLALSGAVHEPDLYKCIVGMAGVYDWTEVMRDAADGQYHSGEYGRLKLKLGDPNSDPDKFFRISPINFVEKMKAPMFVAHGKDDSVASVLESKRLVNALEEHDVVHESLFISREGHGMGHLENQVELLEKVEAFLVKHL